MSCNNNEYYNERPDPIFLLGYVYLSNGKMLNEEIVKAGYANVMTIPPNVKYQYRFLKAYQEARGKERGLWKKRKRER